MLQLQIAINSLYCLMDSKAHLLAEHYEYVHVSSKQKALSLMKCKLWMNSAVSKCTRLSPPLFVRYTCTCTLRCDNINFSQSPFLQNHCHLARWRDTTTYLVQMCWKEIFEWWMFLDSKYSSSINKNAYYSSP